MKQITILWEPEQKKKPTILKKIIITNRIKENYSYFSLYKINIQQPTKYKADLLSFNIKDMVPFRENLSSHIHTTIQISWKHLAGNRLIKAIECLIVDPCEDTFGTLRQLCARASLLTSWSQLCASLSKSVFADYTE